MICNLWLGKLQTCIYTTKQLKAYYNSMESGCFSTCNVSNTVIEENLRKEKKNLRNSFWQCLKQHIIVFKLR
jgi:hypothetical protein